MLDVLAFASVASLVVGGPPISLSEGWVMRVSQNPMDDAIQAVAQKRGEGIILVLSCDTNQPKSILAEVRLKDYLGSADRYRVIYRVDKNAPVEGRWRVAFRGGGSTIYPVYDQQERFVSDIMSGSRLAIQSETYEKNARDIVRAVDIVGIANAANQMASFCDPPSSQ